MTVRHPGFCKVCGSPTHEIERQFPVGHALAGRARKVGKVLPGVVRVSIVLTSGSFFDIKVHRECADLLTPERMPILWRDILDTFRFEEDHRVALGAKMGSQKQKEALESYLVNLAGQVPLGVVCMEDVR